MLKSSRDLSEGINCSVIKNSLSFLNLGFETSKIKKIISGKTGQPLGLVLIKGNSVLSGTSLIIIRSTPY
jgi:hypothetical protein